MMCSTARVSRLLTLVAFVGAWLGSAALAHADGAILFADKVADRDRATITVAITDAAKQVGSTYIEGTFTDQERDDILACLGFDRPDSCIGRILTPHRVTQLAVIRVSTERHGTKPPDLIVTQQIVVASSPVVFIQRRTCEECDAPTLRQHVFAMTRKILESSATNSSKTILSIKSVPAGARITFDGDAAGSTDATVVTYPGKHTIMVQATGYEAVVRDLTAVEGETTTLALTLQRTTEAPPPPPGTRRSPLPWIVIGAGATALLAGGILFAIDEDPSPAGDFQFRDTAPAGVGMMVTGVVVVGIGVVLAVRGRAAKPSRPTASITPRAVSFGWETRF